MAVALFTAPQDEQRRSVTACPGLFAVAMLFVCGVGLLGLTVLRLFGLG
jgi:hypothetical protein